MQLSLETFIHNGSNANVVQGPDGAEFTSTEGPNFSESLRTSADSSTPDNDVGTDVSVAGIPLPSAGNLLPPVDTIEPLKPDEPSQVMAVAPANAGIVARHRSGGEVDMHRRAADLDAPNNADGSDQVAIRSIRRPSSDADNEVHSPALALEAEGRLNTTGEDDPEVVLLQSHGGVARANGLASTPASLALPGESARTDLIGHLAAPGRAGQELPGPQTNSKMVVSPMEPVRPNRPTGRLAERRDFAHRGGLASDPAVRRAMQLPSSDKPANHNGDPRVVVSDALARQKIRSESLSQRMTQSRLPVGRIAVSSVQPDIFANEAPVPVLRDSGPGPLISHFVERRDLPAATDRLPIREILADSRDGLTKDLAAPRASAELPGAKPSIAPVLPSGQAIMPWIPIASVNAAAPTSVSVPVAPIETPVFDTAWADALQDRVTWLVDRNIRTAEIRLNPADLGPLQVQISVDENTTKITFSAAHAITREALEVALPRLKDMLSENGMSLADASVTEQGIADRRAHSDSSEQAGMLPGDDETLAVIDPSPRRLTAKAPSGLVDTYA